MAARVLGYAAAIQVVGLLGVFVKHAFMVNSAGYLTVSRYLGRVNVAELTLADRLHFFASDLLWNLALLPAACALAAAALPRRAQPMFIGVAVIALALVHFIELITFSTIGRFISWDLLREAFAWVRVSPGAVSENVSLSSALKLFGVIAVGIGVVLVVSIGRNPRWLVALKRAAAASAAVLILTGLLAPPLLHQQPLVALVHSRAALAMQLEEMAPTSVSKLAGLSVEELARRYDERVHAPACPNRRAHFATEQDKDIVFFVFETAPRPSFDAARKAGWLAAADALAAQAFVAEQHYSTYPYTSDALFSMFIGRYPINRRNLFRSGPVRLDSSLPRLLERRGYTFHVYASFGDAFEQDSVMYESLGASTIFVPDERALAAPQVQARVREAVAALGPDSPVRKEPLAHFRQRLAQDLSTLERMTADVLKMKGEGRRFSAVFLPQIGHAPWFDVDGVDDVVARGAAALRIQDRWLHELVEALRAGGYLDSTIIVLTGDHGVRTKNEDPQFAGGAISSYSFHVPLVIYAPNAAPSARVTAQMTSHVDLPSTLASLLGVEDAGLNQGSPIWCDDLDRRTTFFFARGYLGADGFRAARNFVMHDALTGAVYESDELDFGARKLAPQAQASSHIQLLTDVRDITSAWNEPAPKATCNEASARQDERTELACARSP